MLTLVFLFPLGLALFTPLIRNGIDALALLFGLCGRLFMLDRALFLAV